MSTDSCTGRWNVGRSSAECLTRVSTCFLPSIGFLNETPQDSPCTSIDPCSSRSRRRFAIGDIFQFLTCPKFLGFVCECTQQHLCSVRTSDSHMLVSAWRAVSGFSCALQSSQPSPPGPLRALCEESTGKREGYHFFTDLYCEAAS